MDYFRSVMDEGNARADKREKNTVYNYVILDKNFNKTGETGKCYITNRYYDPCFDYNIITFVDIDTGEKHRECQFFVEFKECK